MLIDQAEVVVFGRAQRKRCVVESLEKQSEPFAMQRVFDAQFLVSKEKLEVNFIIFIVEFIHILHLVKNLFLKKSINKFLLKNFFRKILGKFFVASPYFIFNKIFVYGDRTKK